MIDLFKRRQGNLFGLSDSTSMALASFALLFVTVLASLGIGYLVQHSRFIKPFDDAGYVGLIGITHWSWLNALVAPVNYNFFPWGGAFIPSFLVVLVLVFLAWMGWRRRKDASWALLSLLLGTIGSAILFTVTTYFIFRVRPFEVLPNHLDDIAKSAWRSWNSFPSGHTRDTAMYMTVISAYLPRVRWVAFVLTLFVAFSRVYVGAHYPTDALAGVLTGCLVGVSAYWLTLGIRSMAFFTRKNA